MAQNYSELAILEGNDNCIPVRLNGIVVDVPKHYFDTNLYNVKDVLDHDNQNLLNGIAEHFENEGLMIGDDGFVYASIDPEDTTLSGDDYEPIGLLHGEELELSGFKFKMPKFKMPGKKKSGGKGQLIKTKNPMLKSVGNLATKGFRTFNPIGALGKQGIIGRNLKGLKNPFKGLGKIKLGNPFKKLKFGGKKGGKGAGLMDAFSQMQEMQAQQNESQQVEEIVEETQSEDYSSDTPQEEEQTTDYPSDDTQSEDYSSDTPQEEEQTTDYPSDDTQSEDYSNDTPQEEEEPANLGASSTKADNENKAFAATTTAVAMIPGWGTAAAGVMSIGKGLYDGNKGQREAKKRQSEQQRLSLIQNLIKNNPKKKVVVVKNNNGNPQQRLIKQSPQLIKQPPQIKQNNFSSTTPRLRAAQETDYQPTQKKDNSMMIGLAAAAAIAVLAMSGKEK